MSNDPLLEEFTYDSMFGEAQVFCVETLDGEPLRMLYIGDGFQSATYLGDRRFEPPFAYCKAFDRLFDIRPDAKRILLIGGGAFTYPKHVLTTRSDVSMDVVEIDPVVIEIACRHFYLDELEKACSNRLNAFAADGFEFLSGIEEGTYDAIVNDAFAGTLQDSPLLSAEGLALTKRALKPGGVYVANAIAQNQGDPIDWPAIDYVTENLKGEFKMVFREPVDDENFFGSINHIFLAY